MTEGKLNNGNGLRIAIGVNGVHEGGTRLPPQNIDAEEALLSAILIDPACLPAVRALLPGPQAFFREMHATIYRRICDLADLGKPIEGIALADELTRRGEFVRLGGDEVLWRIMAASPSAANAAYHAGIVREKWIARELVVDAEARLEDAYANRFTASELVARTVDRVERIEGLSGDQDGEGSLILDRVSDVAREEISWLWPGKIVRGKVNMIIGDPDGGKSFLTMALSACVSAGAPWPDSAGECSEIGSVILLAAEDTVSDTIRPRLEAAGADITRIYAVGGVKGAGKTRRPFSLRHDMGRLEKRVRQVGDVRMVVLDPIGAYLGGADEFRNAEVRDLITPLADLAADLGFAAVLVNHLNKGTGKALYRATGSLAFVAASRMVWLVVKDATVPDRRLFVPAKANLVASPTGLAYRIVDGILQWESEPLKMTAEEALDAERIKPERQERQEGDGRRGPIPAKTKQAMKWLQDRLEVGPEQQGNVMRAAEAAGITTKTFYRAMDGLHVEQFEVDGRKWLRLDAVPCNGNDEVDAIPF